jgi:hypothetical protein
VQLESLWSGWREQILLDNKRGWKSTKIQPNVKCFLLTSPLIELFKRTSQRMVQEAGSVANRSGTASALYQYEVDSYVAVSRTFRVFQTPASAYGCPHLH